MRNRYAWATWLAAAALLPFEVPLFSLGGLVISSVEAALLIALGAWGATLVRPWRWPALPPRVVGATLLVLVVALLSALFARSYTSAALKFTARLGIAALWGAALIDQATSVQRRREAMAALVLGSSAAALLGLGEWMEWRPLLRLLSIFRPAPTFVGGQLRISGPLVYATVAASLWAMTLPLAVGLALPQRRWWLAVALMVEALVLSLTRAAWLGGIVALAALAMLALPWPAAPERLRQALPALAWPGKSEPMRHDLLSLPGMLAGFLLLIGFHSLALPVFQTRLTSESGAGWLRASYGAPGEVTLAAGTVSTVPVQLRNDGKLAWESAGPRPFHLAYQLFDGRGQKVVEREGTRSLLPARVYPGDTITLQANVRAPQTPGEYLIRWDMVQEHTAWFTTQSVPPGETRLRVVGSGVRVPPPTGGSAVAPRLPTVGPPPPPVESSRRVLWPIALAMGLNHPLLGVGPNNFRYHWGPLAGLREWDTTVHANNLYLEAFAGTGLLGILSSAIWLVSLWPAVRATLRCWPQALVRPGVFALAGLAAWYAHGMLDTFLEFTPTYACFAALVGLLLSDAPLRSDG